MERAVAGPGCEGVEGGSGGISSCVLGMLDERMYSAYSARFLSLFWLGRSEVCSSGWLVKRRGGGGVLRAVALAAVAKCREGIEGEAGLSIFRLCA